MINPSLRVLETKLRVPLIFFFYPLNLCLAPFLMTFLLCHVMKSFLLCHVMKYLFFIHLLLFHVYLGSSHPSCKSSPFFSVLLDSQLTLPNILFESAVLVTRTILVLDCGSSLQSLPLVFHPHAPVLCKQGSEVPSMCGHAV